MSEPEEKLSEQAGKLTEIIPDFFFELISRIAPGFVVIALSLYWGGCDFKTVFSNTGLSAWMLPAALAAAWIIGVTLDVGVFCIGKKLRLDEWLLQGPKDGSQADPKSGLQPDPKDHDEYKRWQYRCKSSSWERGRMGKAEAQVIFFRNMMSVCALTALICVIMELSSSLDSLLPVLHGHPWTYLALAIFFFFIFWPSWLMMRLSLRMDWVRLLRLKKMEEAQSDEVRFHSALEFRKSNRTGGQWMAFCPKCHVPALVDQSINEHVLCTGCGWNSHVSAGLVPGIISKLPP